MFNKIVITLIACLVATAAMGTTKNYKTKVLQTAVIEIERGGCMVKLAKAPAEVGLVCDGPWVHFSCDGSINSQSEGYQKLEAAQLALVTGSSIKIKIDDDEGKIIDGHCYASRIDNFAD